MRNMSVCVLMALVAVISGQCPSSHAQYQERIINSTSAIDVDRAGNLFVLEVPGTSTIFGGTDRLLRFPAGQSDFTVLTQDFPGPPLALLVDDSNDVLYVSHWEASLPSDDGALVQYDMNTGQWSTLLESVPTIWDMHFDEHGNILAAGQGAWGGTLRAVGYIPASLDRLIPIRTGLSAWTVASDASQSIYFSTGYPEPSIRVLTMVPESASLALLLPLSAFAFLRSGRSSVTMENGSAADPGKISES